MTCLNSACENYQKDLGATKFCPECGQKTASPEPQSLTCPSAGCANQGKDLGRMKFCSECGTTTVAGVSAAPNTPAIDFASKASAEAMQLPPVELPSGYAAYQGSGAGTGGSSRSIIAGDQNITHSTVIHNQDQTKQIRQCAVSGRQAEVTRGHVCPSCERWVHADFFNFQQRKCCDCEQEASVRSRTKFSDLLNHHLDDGLITESEFAELRELGDSLGIPLTEQNSIISAARKRKAPREKPLSILETTKLNKVLGQLAQSDILDCDSSTQILADLRLLIKSHPENQQITSLLLIATALFLSQSNIDILSSAREIIQTSPAFAGDTPGKYFILSMFARLLIVRSSATRESMTNLRSDVLTTLESADNDQRIRMKSRIESLCPLEIDEEINHIFSEAVTSLEQHFASSTECLAVRTMILLDHGWQSDSHINTVQEIQSLTPYVSLDAATSDLDYCLEQLYSWLSNTDTIKEPQCLQVPQRPMAQIYYNACYGINRFTVLGNVQRRLSFLINTHSGSVLTEEVAKSFLDYGLVDTSKFFHITDDAAQILGATHKPLNLDGLTSISIGAAMALKGVRGHLSLNGLRAISDEVAFAISQVVAELELNQLATISETGLLTMFYFRSKLCERGLIENYFSLANLDVTQLSMEFCKIAYHGLIYINASDIGIREPDTGWRIWLEEARDTDYYDYQEKDAFEIKLRTFWKSLSDPRYETMLGNGFSISSPYPSLTDTELRRRFPQLYPESTSLQTTANAVPQNLVNYGGPPPLPTSSCQNELEMIDVASIVYSSAENLRDEHIFIHPSIPEKKLSNAKSKMNCTEQFVIMLIDDTIFGSAKEGAIVTPKGLYVHNFGETEKFIEWTKIRSVEAKSSRTGVFSVYINGQDFLRMCLTKKEASHAFVSLVQKISKIHKDLF